MSAVSSKLQLSLVLFLALCGIDSIQANEWTDATGLADIMAGKGDGQPLQEYGVRWGGWLNLGVTASSNKSTFNGPVTFGDRNGELQMNQFYLFIQRAVNTEGSDWDIGGRFDFMLGTDAIFTQAYGSPRGHWDLHLMDDSRFMGIALPQAYAEIFMPIGRGITAKIGHFYTPIGNEVVTAPDNFFYSHAYTMQYGEPFTHTGLMLSYPVDDNWSVLGGIVTGSDTGGWDGAWDKGLGNWNGLGGVTWTSDDKDTSVFVSGTTGATSEHDANSWSIYSIVFKQNFLDAFHYTLQHDQGFANKVAGIGDATWYGINQYLTYDIQDNLGVGVRAEWFRDDDGFRVASPARTLTYFPGANNYYGVTVGLNWKPLTWVMVRPNLRYDWVDKSNSFNNGHGDTGYAANRNDQFLFSTDVVINF